MLKIQTNTPAYLIYPNPTTGDLFISRSDVYEGHLDIEVYDLSGRLVLQKSLSVQDGLTELKTSFDSGLYQLKIISSDGVISVQKITVSK